MSRVFNKNSASNYISMYVVYGMVGQSKLIGLVRLSSFSVIFCQNFQEKNQTFTYK
jgi:hypothetical protein